MSKASEDFNAVFDDEERSEITGDMAINLARAKYKDFDHVTSEEQLEKMKKNPALLSRIQSAANPAEEIYQIGQDLLGPAGVFGEDASSRPDGFNDSGKSELDGFLEETTAEAEEATSEETASEPTPEASSNTNSSELDNFLEG